MAALGIAAVDVVLFAAGGEALTSCRRIVAVLRPCLIPAVQSAFPHRYPQAEFTRTVAELGGLGPAQRALLERLHGNAGVDTRHIVLPLAEYGDPARDRGQPTTATSRRRPTSASGRCAARSRRPGWPPATWTC